MSSMKRPVAVLFILFSCMASLCAQDLTYARSVIDTLCSPFMHGRGYSNIGDRIAADYLQEQFVQSGLYPFEEGYQLDVDFPVNTFSEQMVVYVNKTLLNPAEDYYVFPSSTGINGTFELQWLKARQLKQKSFNRLLEKGFGHKIPVVDESLVTDELQRQFFHDLRRINLIETQGILFLKKESELAWHFQYATRKVPYCVLEIDQQKLPRHTRRITLDIDNEYHELYDSKNVVGFVKGKLFPDSVLLIGAHYDHLGKMGRDVYFPGAHDNASGVAMMLDLARYYGKPENQPDKTLVFVAFTGEELGLQGSREFSLQPPFHLSHVNMMINLDIISTGSEGIMIVNGDHCQKCDLLKAINQEKHYVKDIKTRPNAPNSDHYPFAAKGIPAIFIYTLGNEYAHYHTVDDRPEGLPLTAYNELFRLLHDFLSSL